MNESSAGLGTAHMLCGFWLDMAVWMWAAWGGVSMNIVFIVKIFLSEGGEILRIVFCSKCTS